MKSLEFTGKNVQEAINKGVAEMGCDKTDVDIEILEIGTPGLFGLFGKPARVKLTLKQSDDDLGIKMPVMTLDETASQSKDKEPRAQEKKADQPKKAKQEKPAPKKNREPKQAKQPKANKPEPQPEESPAPAPEPEAPFVETPEDQLSENAKRARDFVTELTARMGVPAGVSVCETEEQIRMVLSGEKMSIIIGRRGETLDAVQYLTSLHINRKNEDYIRVSLDTENYRAKREEALRKLAVRMAGRCKKTGKRVALEPMNPYERRILHSALQSDPDVSTHSEGEEPYRRVIITLN